MEKVEADIAVVGAGPVGCLQAIYLARCGYSVRLYEGKPDSRALPASVFAGRSINFALSARGRAAIRRVGLEELVSRDAIPMYSRMIHSAKQVNGETACYTIPYGENNESILSVGRRKINEILLSAAEAEKGVSIVFEAEITGLDCRQAALALKGERQPLCHSFVFGCDGIHSKTMQQMLQQCNDTHHMRETFIAHGYKELNIPAIAKSPKGGADELEYAMPPNHLHIWPRGEFMLIALPNPDKSFTLTLFMPMDIFEDLALGVSPSYRDLRARRHPRFGRDQASDRCSPDEAALHFLRYYFPDCVKLVGEEEIIRQFNNNPLSRLSYIDVEPWNVARYCGMGDAVHAVVPFYGQGMNCGLEDCLVFQEAMARVAVRNDADTAVDHESERDRREAIARSFEDSAELFYRLRKADANALCQLSLENYIEMRASVTNPLFLLKKKADSVLYALLPQLWVPQYQMVAFSRTPYDEIIRRRNRQNRILNVSAAFGVLVVTLTTVRGLQMVLAPLYK